MDLGQHMLLTRRLSPMDIRVYQIKNTNPIRLLLTNYPLTIASVNYTGTVMWDSQYNLSLFPCVMLSRILWVYPVDVSPKVYFKLTHFCITNESMHSSYFKATWIIFLYSKHESYWLLLKKNSITHYMNMTLLNYKVTCCNNHMHCLARRYIHNLYHLAWSNYVCNQISYAPNFPRRLSITQHLTSRYLLEDWSLIR